MRDYKDFKNFMAVDCGMPLTADGLAECIECREAPYPSDFKGHDWVTCPVCGYNWETDEYEDCVHHDFWGDESEDEEFEEEGDE